MFSTNQKTLLESLIPTMLSKGYKNYVAYTNTNNSYQSTEPDLYVIFSKNEIVGIDSYTFDIPSETVIASIKTGNYSTSSYADNTDRIVLSELSETTLSINLYEHIYTNVSFTDELSVQPDLMAEGSANTIYGQYNSVILTAIFFFLVIWKMWKIRK